MLGDQISPNFVNQVMWTLRIRLLLMLINMLISYGDTSFGLQIWFENLVSLALRSIKT